MPGLAATFEVLSQVRRRAQRAGVKITPADVEEYERAVCGLQLDHCRRMPFDAELAAASNGPGLPRNVARMLAALFKQPDGRREIASSRSTLERIVAAERRAALRESSVSDAEASFASEPSLYTAQLARITFLRPLSPNAPPATFLHYRSAMRELGIVVAHAHFLLYRLALAPRNGFAQRWTAGRLSAEDARLCGLPDVPLSIAILDDLRRPRNDRALLALDAGSLAAAIGRRHATNRYPHANT